MTLPKGVSERGQGIGVDVGAPGGVVGVGITGTAVGVPFVSALVVAVPEAPVAVGVCVPEDDEGVREHAAATINTASSVMKTPACEMDLTNRMSVTFYAAAP